MLDFPHRPVWSGFLVAVFLNLPFYSYALEKDWDWASAFPFIWMNNTLSAFLTFFHEIGHSITGWFYGVPTIPMFDFVHGGGWSWMVTDQKLALVFCIWAGLAYLWYMAVDYEWLRKILIGIFVFNVVTIFNTNLRLAIFDFMGPAFEALCGGAFLTRALFNLFPRGKTERYLSMALGFAFPFHSLIDGYSLLHNQDARERYYQQKDAQGAGDFDQIADKLDFASFEGAVHLWMALTVICLIAPFVLYLCSGYKEEAVN